MTEPDDRPPDNEGEFRIPDWDAEAVMRRRADDARKKRDAAIAELRESMTDEDALHEFGLDLGQIED